MDNKSQVGGKPFSHYRARYPECAINTRPRIRVIAIQAVDGSCPGECFIFDLDAMTSVDRQRLIDTVMHDHILVGHNIFGFDLAWLVQETEKRPQFVLDTLMLTRLCKPEMLLYLNHDAATADTERAQLATETLTGKAESRASLEYLALCLGRAPLDKTYQKPHNWCVTTLSSEHYGYVLDDIEVPVEILKHIFGSADSLQIVERLHKDHPWYIDFAKAAYTVSSSKGVPYSDHEAGEVAVELREELAATVEQLKQWSEFTGEALRILADPRKGISAEPVIKVMEAHALKNGLQLPRTETGKVSLASKAMKFAGLTDRLPCWSAFEHIQKLKKALSTVEQFRSHARVDGRIHSLVAFTTAAGRTSCSEPNDLCQLQS